MRGQPNDHRFHLYVCHSLLTSGEHSGLVRLLDHRLFFHYQLHHLPVGFAPGEDADREGIHAQIWRHMAGCQAVLSLAGLRQEEEPWLRQELEVANQGFGEPVPIVVIKPWTSTRVSGLLAGVADRLVDWKAGQIIDAVRAVAGPLEAELRAEAAISLPMEESPREAEVNL